ncbi:hypothetical protein CCMA1212_010264 [Trichoderma ghanense]|uniref:Uncharacterized protein n=1 Tax=Trichoderma ghanense TaxID=65468 RepID=A0ABY2GT18_9HYPO
MSSWKKGKDNEDQEAPGQAQRRRATTSDDEQRRATTSDDDAAAKLLPNRVPNGINLNAAG